MQCLDAISTNDRMISVHFQGKPFNITVIQVYAPTSNAEEAEVEQFYEDLQDLLELTPKKDVLFIIGDWNAKVGSQETPGVTGKFGLGVRNEAEQRLIVFCQENALVIANTLLFTWGQTVVEVMKMMVTSLKRSHACAVTLSAPNPAAGHHHPTPPPETQTPTGKSGTVSCGVTAPFPWVLVHKVLLCPPRIYLPVFCKFWLLYSGVNGDLLQEGLCHTQVCCTQSPEPLSLWQTTTNPYLHRRCSTTVLSQSLWGSWVLVCTKFV